MHTHYNTVCEPSLCGERRIRVAEASVHAERLEVPSHSSTSHSARLWSPLLHYPLPPSPQVEDCRLQPLANITA
jgi:hypothetical protein